MYDLFNLNGDDHSISKIPQILMEARWALNCHSQGHYRKVLFQQQKQITAP